MKPLMLCAAALLVAFGLSACERETKTSSTTIVQPKETVKEKQTLVVPTPTPGPAGPQGPQGEPGKPGGDTVVNVNPAKKE
jgi:hypothetical protein